MALDRWDAEPGPGGRAATLRRRVRRRRRRRLRPRHRPGRELARRLGRRGERPADRDRAVDRRRGAAARSASACSRCPARRWPTSGRCGRIRRRSRSAAGFLARHAHRRRAVLRHGRRGALADVRGRARRRRRSPARSRRASTASTSWPRTSPTTTANETRFVVLARQLHTGPADKGSIVLTTDDRVRRAGAGARRVRRPPREPVAHRVAAGRRPARAATPSSSTSPATRPTTTWRAPCRRSARRASRTGCWVLPVGPRSRRLAGAEAPARERADDR